MAHSRLGGLSDISQHNQRRRGRSDSNMGFDARPVIQYIPERMSRNRLSGMRAPASHLAPDPFFVRFWYWLVDHPAFIPGLLCLGLLVVSFLFSSNPYILLVRFVVTAAAIDIGILAYRNRGMRWLTWLFMLAALFFNPLVHFLGNPWWIHPRIAAILLFAAGAFAVTGRAEQVDRL